MLVAEECKNKITFASYAGTYWFSKMSFGYMNAPAVFQRALEVECNNHTLNSCLVHLDDIIIFSKNSNQHLKNIEDVLPALYAASVFLRLKKCHWLTKKVG